MSQQSMPKFGMLLALRTIFTVHINFGEQREFSPTLLRKGLDLRIASRLLPACTSRYAGIEV